MASPTPPSNAPIADLSALVSGAHLWMRDPRRTPVRVIHLQEDIASFTVEVLDFEDKGAVWTFPLWQADKFLSDPASPRLPANQVKTLRAASKRLNRSLQISVDATKRKATEDKLSALTRDARRWLIQQGHTASSATSLEAFSAFTDHTALSGWLAQHNALMLEEDFARQYVSNPHAGESIKAHRLALTELGLCPYDGRILRDADELAGGKALPHRMRHILTRLAFLRAAFGLLGQTHVSLYRTIYSDAPLTPPRNTGLISTTFSHTVAWRFLKDGETKAHRALHWQNVPVTRLFMTHLETPQMRAPYDEAEALLIFDPEAKIF